MKRYIKHCFLIIYVLLLGSCSHSKENQNSYSKEIEVLQSWAERKNANKRYFFLVDFSIHSGKKRMFLYDVQKGEIIRSYMVAHGKGNTEKNHTPIKFSNTEGSLCSSLGIAMFGERAYSKWGINVKYWLDGLENSNSNMRKRIVVIHSYGWVSNEETYPIPLVKSEGCLMVSNKAMEEIDKFIQSLSNKRVLVYSFRRD